ncbi:MAG TPA: serine/threonine-protein kinase [Verrucomicrobiae bacterium]|nr:serine/threonine-protein kinase [Verrucomicrobiae bacterium]
MNFSASEWALLARYLDEGMDLPPDKQEQWLESLPDLDPRLKQALAAMLRRNRDPENDLLIRTLPKLGPNPAPALERIGPYRTLRELGFGGMASVWLAERADGALTRQVALKLPHSAGRKRFLERFRLERDILASFTHPNIAQIYDAGVTEAGRPYIALEYVDGTPLTQHCDSLGLGLSGRLHLFFQVLSAVQYAHSRLVIHRDLKPSNILATRSGEIKLLDFGIAKLLGPERLEDAPDLTLAGERALTLDYAAPEQILGQAVSTSADIYSLGVVLFELLAGKRPYTLRDAAHEKAILSLDLPRPSDAARQQSKPYWKALQGDLDAIVLKALQTDPAGRYPTADALAQDLHRFLNGEPVSAQPESLGYRARKFLVRNRLSVSAAAAVFLALAVGLGVALWQAREARKSARTAQAVENFVIDIFHANSSDQPDPARARETTARQLLDIGAAKLERSLDDAPEARLEVLSTISDMYIDLGIDDTAVQLTRERLKLTRSLYGNESPEVAEVLVRLARNMQSSSFARERPQVLLEAKKILDRAGDSYAPLRAKMLTALAEEYASTNWEKGLDSARQAVELSRKSKPEDRVEALLQLASILSRLDRDRESLPLFGQAIAVSRQIGWSSMLLKLYVSQAEAYRVLLDTQAAEQSYRDAYQLARSLNGAEHVDTIQTEIRLGSFLADFGRDREGLRLMEEAYRVSLKLRGPEDPFHVPTMQEQYGSALARYGRLREGIDLLRLAIANRRKNRPGTAYLAQMLEEAGRYEIDLGHYAQAEKDLDAAAEIREKTKSQASSSDRVKLLLALGKPLEAAALLKGRATSDALTFLSLRERRDRAAVELANGNPQAALSIASAARAQIAAHPGRASLAHFEETFSQVEAEADLAMGATAPALALFDSLIRQRGARLDPNSPYLVESRLGAAEAAGKSGRAAERAQLCNAAKSVIFGVPLGEHYQKRFHRVCAPLVP